MSTEILQFVRKFPKCKVLVVGDAMLDEYIEGTADRISPEAPIPVFLQKSLRHVPGGAGNVAGNVAALGARVTLVGVAGKDERAKILESACRARGIRTRLIRDARPTTTKTRFVSGHHQLARIDIEETSPISSGANKLLIRAIRASLPADIIIVSDYGKGVVTKDVMAALKSLHGADAIVADMKPANARHFRGIRAITPNLKESLEMTGIDATHDAGAKRAARLIAARLKTSVVLTRGEHGVTALERESGECAHVTSHVQSVKDVTGAGDTVIAVFALMLSAGASFMQAARSANLAAGLVVAEPGTYALTHAKLKAELTSESR